MKEFLSINPATEEVIYRFPPHSPEEVEKRLERAYRAFLKRKNEDFSYRRERAMKLSSLLEEKKEFYAKIITQEMGKPFHEAVAEIEKCAWVCRYYAEKAEEFLSPIKIPTEAKESYVVFMPLGVILLIMPWNFPFWQVFRCAIPLLMAGNTCLVKHAPNTMKCMEEIEKLFHEAGWGEEFFHIKIDPEDALKLLEDPRIQGVSLTGSTRAGRAVAKKAGECLKKSVLELGGSDPYIFFPDFPVEKGVEIAITSRLINSGQSCVAAKRFFIHKKIYPDFKECLIEKLKTKKIGNPLEKVDCGPLARKDLKELIQNQVKRSQSQGAKVLYEHKEYPKEKGFYFPIMVLEDPPKDSPLCCEELFGPVFSLFSWEKEEEMLQEVHRSSYGLGSAVFSQDISLAKRLAEKELFAGLSFVNSLVKSDPRLPFGGVKDSGYGRELSFFGIREFCNIKTVVVA